MQREARSTEIKAEVHKSNRVSGNERAVVEIPTLKEQIQGFEAELALRTPEGYRGCASPGWCG